MAAVERRGPALRAEYDELYAEDRPSGMPLPRRAAEQARRLDRLVRARGLPTMIPHDVYQELLSTPDALYVLFCHMQGLYAARGVDVRPLRAATGRYADWLAGERTALRRSLGRSRAQSPLPEPFPVTGVLTERLLALSEGGGLAEVLGNARLAALAANVLAGGAFDYTTLRVWAGVPV